MPNRPRLSDESFLAHIFSPKKNRQPTGLRKVALSGVKNRSAKRLRAFNRMTSVQQEILNRAGMREAYLRGDSSLADARRALRPRAVSIGVAKPVRQRTPAIPKFQIRTSLDRLIAQHIKRTVRAAGQPLNERTVDRQTTLLEAPEDEMLDWDYGHIRYAARPGSDYEVFVDGQTQNPFWYH